MAQLWGGRFTKETDQLVYNFNASISFDQKFYKQDITGSKAHVKMLAAQGILTEAERDQILEGLDGILRDVENGTLKITDKHTFTAPTSTPTPSPEAVRNPTGRTSRSPNSPKATNGSCSSGWETRSPTTATISSGSARKPYPM